ncbi:hypothetical protein [Maribacter antarcticus]|uniref:hypothetical protein n=1 Tax=Maribacter antarcticus TaxID=505250 RepID=UPI000B288B86|nr:hypothetical protein [Maribacter antarcticus]
MPNNFDSQGQRNRTGKRLEKDESALEAIVLYNANIYQNFEGSFPYQILEIL